MTYNEEQFVKELWDKIDGLTDKVNAIQEDRHTTAINYALVLKEVKERLGENWRFGNDGQLVTSEDFWIDEEEAKSCW